MIETALFGPEVVWVHETRYYPDTHLAYVSNLAYVSIGVIQAGTNTVKFWSDAQVAPLASNLVNIELQYQFWHSNSTRNTGPTKSAYVL